MNRAFRALNGNFWYSNWSQNLKEVYMTNSALLLQTNLPHTMTSPHQPLQGNIGPDSVATPKIHCQRIRQHPSLPHQRHRSHRFHRSGNCCFSCELCNSISLALPCRQCHSFRKWLQNLDWFDVVRSRPAVSLRLGMQELLRIIGCQLVSVFLDDWYPNTWLTFFNYLQFVPNTFDQIVGERWIRRVHQIVFLTGWEKC